METRKFVEVPLADELFETIQGHFGPYARPMEEIESLAPESRKTLQYHTYINTVVGKLDDEDTQNTLRMAFEAYLRRLRENIQPAAIQKPVLFWRFRRGEHISVEWSGKKRDSKVTFYTRLVVPSCTLVICQQCLRTEGEPHASHCANIVRRVDAR